MGVGEVLGGAGWVDPVQPTARSSTVAAATPRSVVTRGSPQPARMGSARVPPLTSTSQTPGICRAGPAGSSEGETPVTGTPSVHEPSAGTVAQRRAGASVPATSTAWTDHRLPCGGADATRPRGVRPDSATSGRSSPVSSRVGPEQNDPRGALPPTDRGRGLIREVCPAMVGVGCRLSTACPSRTRQTCGVSRRAAQLPMHMSL